MLITLTCFIYFWFNIAWEGGDFFLSNKTTAFKVRQDTVRPETEEWFAFDILNLKICFYSILAQVFFAEVSVHQCHL